MPTRPVGSKRCEVLEETAHRFEPTGLVGIYRWHCAAKDITFLRFCFKGKILSSDPELKLDTEIVALHWLTAGELTNRAAQHRSPLVQKCVDDFVAGRHFSLEVLC